jgi:hypothetical protein
MASRVPQATPFLQSASRAEAIADASLDIQDRPDAISDWRKAVLCRNLRFTGADRSLKYATGSRSNVNFDGCFV